MFKQHICYRMSIATLFIVAMLFLSCDYNYKRVGDEVVPKIYPGRIGENFTMTYSVLENQLKSEATDTAKVKAILSSPLCEDFTNLTFGHRKFPKSLQVDYFDKDGNKSVVTADFGLQYTVSNLIDLRGNVVINGHDGKRLEAPQLYFDQSNNWIFTQEAFTYTNPEDGTVMDGVGMDFNTDLSALNAHKTTGIMLIKNEEK